MPCTTARTARDSVESFVWTSPSCNEHFAAGEGEIARHKILNGGGRETFLDGDVQVPGKNAIQQRFGLQVLYEVLSALSKGNRLGRFVPPV